MDAFDIDVAMLAGRYTLLEQESLGLLDRCHREGVGIVVAGAFNSGILAGNRKFNYAEAPADILERVEAIEAACEAEGVTMQAAALIFPALHPAVVTIVAGARNGDQLRANAAWFGQDIPATFWRRLKEKGVIHSDAPIGDA
jgi:D-threo-aldose 1-dehydrogenase